MYQAKASLENPGRSAGQRPARRVSQASKLPGGVGGAQGGAGRNGLAGRETVVPSFVAENEMRFLLLLVLLLLLIGALPTWPYSTGWGYYPSGIGLIVLIIVAVLLLRRA